MNYTVRLLCSTLFIIAFSACERASQDSSRIAIKLPTYNSVSALACTVCLKAVFVNVDASEMKKVIFSEEHKDFKEAGTQISAEVVVEVPQGDKRHFQIVAVYYDASSQKILLKYGETTANIQGAEPPPIVLPLYPLGGGEFKGGTISGRYVTANSGQDEGPTGIVTISLVHPTSGSEITFQKSEMNNGWFNFFASENFAMKYQLADGTVLFGGAITLNDIVTSQNVARLHRPTNYYIQQGGSWGNTPEHETDYHDIVYGFFGVPALISSKKICFEGYASMSSMSKVSTANDGSAPMYYSSTNGSGDFYPIGGLNSYIHSSDCTGTATDQRYDANMININKKQLDGNGNDHAISMGGIFTYISTGISGDISKVAYTNQAEIQFKPLPGVMGASSDVTKYNGMKVFKKAGATNGGFDNIKCTPEFFSINGFTEVTGLVVTTTTTQARFHLGGKLASNDGVIVCPTKNSAMTGMGGMYLGSVDFSSIAVSSGAFTPFSGSSNQTITIMNTGTQTLPSMSVSMNTGTYFTTTGTTCGATLNPGSTCTIQVNYNGAAVASDSVRIDYNPTADYSATKMIGVSGSP